MVLKAASGGCEVKSSLCCKPSRNCAVNLYNAYRSKSKPEAPLLPDQQCLHPVPLDCNLEMHKTAQLCKPNSSILLWIALVCFVFSTLRRHLYYKYSVRKKAQLTKPFNRLQFVEENFNQKYNALLDAISLEDNNHRQMLLTIALYHNQEYHLLISTTTAGDPVQT